MRAGRSSATRVRGPGSSQSGYSQPGYSQASSARKGSFERFYLTRVALGDCCGCAERVIDWRDIEHAAHASALRKEGAPVSTTSLRSRINAQAKRLFRRLGILSPPRSA